MVVGGLSNVISLGLENFIEIVILIFHLECVHRASQDLTIHPYNQKNQSKISHKNHSLWSFSNNNSVNSKNYQSSKICSYISDLVYASIVR